MIEIKTFDELRTIEEEKFKYANINDLTFIRYSLILADGYALIIGPDYSERLEMYIMTYETYKTLTSGEKDYLKRWYDIED